jgi:hypothetical protein
MNLYTNSGRPMRSFFLVLSVLTVLLLSCGQEEVNSYRPTGTIKIDGSSEEWEDMLMAMPDQNLAFGICNDDNAVYLCVTTTDRALQMRIMSGGLTVWFDGLGGKKKSLGIRYPVGGPGGRGRGEMPPRQETTEEQRETLRQNRMKFQASDLEIIGEDNEVLERLPVDNKENISARFNINEQTFVYELKVPIQNAGESRYAIPVAARKQISLGMEISAAKAMGGRRPEGRGGQMGPPPDGGGMDGDQGGDRMGGDGMGGGRMSGGRSGGRHGGGPGDRGMNDGMATSDPIKVWLKVNLAK